VAVIEEETASNKATNNSRTAANEAANTSRTAVNKAMNTSGTVTYEAVYNSGTATNGSETIANEAMNGSETTVNEATDYLEATTNRANYGNKRLRTAIERQRTGQERANDTAHRDALTRCTVSCARNSNHTKHKVGSKACQAAKKRKRGAKVVEFTPTPNPHAPEGEKVKPPPQERMEIEVLPALGKEEIPPPQKQIEAEVLPPRPTSPIASTPWAASPDASTSWAGEVGTSWEDKKKADRTRTAKKRAASLMGLQGPDVEPELDKTTRVWPSLKRQAICSQSSEQDSDGTMEDEKEVQEEY